jgi:S-(hydroxymethyl)glutathione dehydrogenase/alcohol dehydrogenase
VAEAISEKSSAVPRRVKTRGAVLLEPGTRTGWSVEELDLEEPKAGEVQVRMLAAGLCHTDEHYNIGDGVIDFKPMLGGHEGAGVVEALGSQVTGVEVGDHVITSLMPACGHCRWCARGQGQLCDRGAGVLSGRALDGTHRIFWNGQGVGPMTFLGTFAERIVCPADSLIKFPADMNPAAAAIVGCAIPTGFGTAVNVADVRVGDVVVVVGTGGVGMAAVQGARVAGARTIVAVDPLQWKREQAARFGATQTAGSIDEALDLVTDLTNGTMADRAIITIGVMDGTLIGPALRLISKGGILAIVSVSPMAQTAATLPIYDFVSYQKQIRGSLYGGWSPRTAIPMLLELYRNGDLLLDELVTRTYPLEEINSAYTDMHEGRNLRGVIVYG